MITADLGSNCTATASGLWKVAMQGLANELDLELKLCRKCPGE